MSAGRRGLLLSVAFGLLALWLSQGERAQAQFPQQFPPGGGNDPHAGRHSIWQSQLTPDQIRELFSPFGPDDDHKQFEKLFRDMVMNKSPNADPKQVDAAVKNRMADKEFMKRAKDLAQKYKNQNREPQNLFRSADLQRDLAKLAKQMSKDGSGDPFKAPKFDPDKLPQFDPKNFDPKNFNPDDFPHADPQNPPRIDPDSGLPLDPRTNRPFDPRTGQPLDPRTGKPPEPKNMDPGAPPTRDPGMPPKAENPPPPPVDPNTGRPIEPKLPDPVPKFDPEHPRAPLESPEKQAKQKAYEAATALWEKNVGPIDETPAVKRAIYDLISDPETMDALTDSNGNSLFDMFDGTGDGFKGLFDGADGKGWEWPKLDWKLDWGKNSNLEFPNAPQKPRWPEGSSNRWPSTDWGSGWGGSFNFGGMRVPWVFALLLLALIVAAVVWWKWEALAQLSSRRGAPIPHGLGPWPLDPREISTREDVVKAFEYLSVLICGPGAKTWTHSTIADELTVLAATHGETALKLARLYELARYAPLDEPLTRAELLEARRLVCDLAGVD
ncbi:MAG TPA: hypothetical protein VGE74_20955 [Gemmata sp.]